MITLMIGMHITTKLRISSDSLRGRMVFLQVGIGDQSLPLRRCSPTCLSFNTFLSRLWAKSPSEKYISGIWLDHGNLWSRLLHEQSLCITYSALRIGRFCI